MLLNFCDSRLRPEIKCDQVCMEGYEVTNLISDSREGFLAYCCIKPPVHIDITFLCNIQISHIIIWPSVGSQKSSGFQLHSKDTNSDSVPYTLLSTKFLTPSDSGLLFHSINVDPNEIAVPENFVKHCIRSSRQSLIGYVHSVRLTICKTEKSVPALGRIEIWGQVSPRCGKDIVASVHSLLTNSQSVSPARECEVDSINLTSIVEKQKVTAISSLEIPESFLDPITWELMMQPITLPSGNIIDQTTLEKYGQNEAIWGRPFSDPFTGIPFDKNYKPIMATALKFRIDKFLLLNSNTNEVKNMARVLGYNSAMTGDRRIMEIPKFMLNENLLRRNTKEATELSTQEKALTSNTLQRLKKHCHQLPAVIAGPNQYAAKMKARSKQAKKISNSKPFYDKSHSSNKDDKSETLITNIDNSLSNSDKFLLSNIKRFNASEKVEYKVSSNCECCNKNIFYMLPCKHVICKKTLLSIKDNRCNSCGSFYETNKIERVYGNILSR